MPKHVNLKDIKKTIWRNDNDVTAKFTFCDDSESMVYVEIEPGETVEIDSRYDHAIQHVHKGIVEGGLCPWLTKLDEKSQPVKHLKMASALDYKRAQALEDVNSIESMRKERETLERVAKYNDNLKGKKSIA